MLCSITELFSHLLLPELESQFVQQVKLLREVNFLFESAIIALEQQKICHCSVYGWIMMLFQQNIQDVIAQDMEMWPLAKGEL